MLRISLLLASYLLVSSCAHNPPDAPFCRALENKVLSEEIEGIGRIVVEVPNPVCMREIGEAVCGYCVWALSDHTYFVGERQRLWGKPWSEVKKTGAIVPVETYAAFKSYSIQACKRDSRCNANITHWRTKADSLDSRLDALP